MLWTAWAWSVVSKVIMDGRNAQYLTDLLEKASKLYKKGRQILLTTTVLSHFNSHLLICACDMDLDVCLRSVTSSEVATSRSNTGRRKLEMLVSI